jgi:hypothetical protein
MVGWETVQDGKGDEGNEGAVPRSRGRSSARFEAGVFDTETTNLDSPMLQQGDKKKGYSLSVASWRQALLPGPGISSSQMYEEEKNWAGDVKREREGEEGEEEKEMMLWRGRGELAIASSQPGDSSAAMGNRRLSGS